MQQCRTSTLGLFSGMDAATFRHQPHADFSPVGWHLGHIAYIESLWLLEHCAGLKPLFPEYKQLFAADGLPKSERVNLPSLTDTRHYLDTVRAKVLNYLEVADLEAQERLLQFLLQHESQHAEIMTFVLLLGEVGDRESGGVGNSLGFQPQGGSVRVGEISCTSPLLPISPSPYPLAEMIRIPAGKFVQGSDSIEALDNERDRHWVYLDTYWIDRYPVTCGEYRKFMAASGYQNPEYWSTSGWEWLQTEKVTQPLYWHLAQENHPVFGVSYYEAEAYARFVGKRLPTEAEWEKAASWDEKRKQSRTYPWGEAPPFNQCNYNHCHTSPVDANQDGQSAYGCEDMLGNVWEWTASWFATYPGFQNYPYVGYSQVYFDQQHRVLKGGSWATRPWALRSSFRNWYYPYMRQILAGFRCASDDECG